MLKTSCYDCVVRIPGLARSQCGISVLELVIASGLSALLGLLLVNLYTHSVRLSLLQQAAARDLDNRVQLHQLLSHVIRDALVFDPLQPGSHSSAESCEGLLLSNRCLPPVMVWMAGSVAPVATPPALANSSVLLVKQSCCTGVVADMYYLGSRSGAGAGQSALFRRRLLGDGRFAPADEMIPQLQSLIIQQIRWLAADAGSGDRVVYGGPAPVAEQWNTLAWRIDAGLRSVSAGSEPTGSVLMFTIAARQGQGW